MACNRRAFEHYEEVFLRDFGTVCRWEDWQYSPSLMSISDFEGKWNQYTQELQSPPPKIHQERIRSALILEDEWNSQFAVAQLEDGYVGFWWETGA